MKIVFIGDSITDCERDRTDENSLGNGFVKILSDKLRPIYPDMDIQLINKGISGNEVCDVLARVNKDVIDLKPDTAVVMIGINNVLHQYKYGKQLDLKQFERDFTELLGKIKLKAARRSVIISRACGISMPPFFEFRRNLPWIIRY